MEKQKFLPFYRYYLQDPPAALTAAELSVPEAAGEKAGALLEDAFTQDWEDALMRSYYPLHIQRMQSVVEGVCDELDYEGSTIYDEYPDPYLLFRAAEQVLQIWEQEFPQEAELVQEMEISEHRYRPEHRPRRRRKRPLEDLARVLLYHEISRRRCRRGKCRQFR